MHKPHLGFCTSLIFMSQRNQFQDISVTILTPNIVLMDWVPEGEHLREAFEKNFTQYSGQWLLQMCIHFYLGLDTGALHSTPSLQPWAVFSTVGQRRRKANWGVKRSTAWGAVSHLDTSWDLIKPQLITWGRISWGAKTRNRNTTDDALRADQISFFFSLKV